MAAASQVAFNFVPGDIRVPVFAAEINAGPPPYSGTSRLIVLGRSLAGAPVAALTPVNVGSTDASTLAGLGSIGAEMLVAARRANPLGEIWYMDMGNPSSGAAATGTIVFAGPATGAGIITRYIGGIPYSLAVGAGDTASTIAAAFAALVNKGYTLFDKRMGSPVVASVSSATVTLTARHTGTEGNAIRIEAGLDGDEIDPAGVTATITGMSGGTGDADMASVLAALGNQGFDWLVAPQTTTSTQLNAVRDFLSNRWSPLVSLDGHFVTSKEGNVSGLTSFGQARNDPHVTVVGTFQIPTVPWIVSAGTAGLIAFYKNLGRSLREAIELARPMQTIALEGVRAPKDPAARFGLADRDSLYRNGITALVWRDDGSAQLDRVITTYRTNAAGLADTTFLDIESVAIALYVKRYMRQKIQGTYPRHVLREDNPRAIQGVATPDNLRATAIHAYKDLSEIAGIVRQPSLFAKYLVVDADYERDRCNFYLPVSKSAALRVFGVNETLFLNLDDQNASGL